MCIKDPFSQIWSHLISLVISLTFMTVANICLHNVHFSVLLPAEKVPVHTENVVAAN